jgi:hypothetical protein
MLAGILKSLRRGGAIRRNMTIASALVGLRPTAVLWTLPDSRRLPEWLVVRFCASPDRSTFERAGISLGDETGIADLTAFFDFDLSPGSLAGMRDWLRLGYSSLEALNAEWGTDFVRWEDVRPIGARRDRGVQIPGWGGYDYSLLVDRRGLILWDSENANVRDDATTGEQGLAYAETFAEIRCGTGALLIASEPHVDPVAILYSPASFRTQWMLEQKPKGNAWMIRKSETELEINTARDTMWAYERAVTHLGLQSACVSSPVDLPGRGFRTVILPHAIAL